MDRDTEQDVQKDRKAIIKDLFRKHGSDLKLMIVLSDLTGKELPEVADAWKHAGELVQDAISSRRS